MRQVLAPTGRFPSSERFLHTPGTVGEFLAPADGFPSEGSYPCTPGTGGWVPAPTDGFPSHGRFLCPPEIWSGSWHPLVGFPIARAILTLPGQHRQVLEPAGGILRGWIHPHSSRSAGTGPVAHQQKAVCVLPGQLGQVLGPASKVVSGWICLHPSSSAAAGSGICDGPGRVGQCLLLESKMVAVINVCPQSFCRWCPVAWEHSQGKKLLWWSHPSPRTLPIMVTFCSGRPRLFPSTPSVATAQPLQAVSTPNPGPLPWNEPWSLSFSTQPPSSLTEECLSLGSTGGQYRPSVQVTLCFVFHKLVEALPLLRFQNSPLHPV